MGAKEHYMEVWNNYKERASSRYTPKNIAEIAKADREVTKTQDYKERMQDKRQLRQGKKAAKQRKAVVKQVFGAEKNFKQAPKAAKSFQTPSILGASLNSFRR